MTRQQLRRLRLYMHKVLALNKATISEIHSYQRPRPLVHTVMKATFRILGEPRSKLQVNSCTQYLFQLKEHFSAKDCVPKHLNGGQLT